MDVAIARAIHVLAIVAWIGGVTMVTSVLLPLARHAGRGFEWFELVERRFAKHARITTVIAGASGFYMTWRFELWDRFREPSYWWMHAMVLVWLLFSLMLFVIEPFFADAWLRRRAARDQAGTIALLQRLHWLLLALSWATIFGAVAGSHGLSF